MCCIISSPILNLNPKTQARRGFIIKHNYWYNCIDKNM